MIFLHNDIIICEGKTDEFYISTALRHFEDDYPNLTFKFLRAGGTDPDNIKDLISKFKYYHNNKKIIVLVDRDTAGEKVYNALSALQPRGKTLTLSAMKTMLSF